MKYIKVEFEPDGKRYIYSTPVDVEKKQIVLVNVYGKIVAATVVAIGKKPPPEAIGPIKRVVGVGFMIEDFQKTQKTEKPSLFERITSLI